MLNKLVIAICSLNLLLVGCSGEGTIKSDPNNNTESEANNNNSSNSDDTTPPDLVTPCKACAPEKIVGIAAGGAPLANGVLGLVDSTGERISATVATDGSYSLDVAGMTGPFLIEVAGLVGGRPTVLHTLAISNTWQRVSGSPPASMSYRAFGGISNIIPTLDGNIWIGSSSGVWSITPYSF
ncbi:MAG: hypothetical protein JW841_18750 [Deltaproteobacteria bacterium]|nr:hypothetical protein [Deltaproteobacteria bacterium]